MITLTFKNVGQGDSIVIEWMHNGVEKIGIIDCNSNNDNPVLQHVISKDYKNIDFIILSHPHFDHFSGMFDLMEYCYSKQIEIGFFLQTCQYFTPDYIRSALSSRKSERAFIKLLHFCRDYLEKTTTKQALLQADLGFEIQFTGTSKIRFGAPTHGDFMGYLRKAKYNIYEEDDYNSPLANLLSSIAIVETKEGSILLTSDCTKAQLGRVKLDNILLLCQSPHHGSGYNHNSAFWSTIPRIKGTPVVFSVGPNKHGHPAQKAVDHFIKNDYVIHATNQVGFLSGKKGVTKRSNALDSFSKIVGTKGSSLLNGEKTFTFPS